MNVVDTPKPAENTATASNPEYTAGSRPYRSAKRPHRYELEKRPIINDDTNNPEKYPDGVGNKKQVQACSLSFQFMLSAVWPVIILVRIHMTSLRPSLASEKI